MTAIVVWNTAEVIVVAVCVTFTLLMAIIAAAWVLNRIFGNRPRLEEPDRALDPHVDTWKPIK